MTSLRTLRILALPLALSILLTGCKQSSITTNLQLVIAAAETAVSVLEGTGTIPPPVGTLINTYLNAVSEGTVFASMELASTDPQPIKASKIIAKFASIAKPDLPAGTAQNIVTVIEAVANAAAKFLATISTAQTALATSAKPLKMTSGDMAAMPKIQARAEALQVRTSKLSH